MTTGPGTLIIRVFSFFIPAGEPPGRYREQVIDRMGALATAAESHGVILAHENEKEIYGDVPQRCADLIESVSSPALRDSGFEGYLSLEPHLARAGRFGGFSGADGFRRAARALRALLAELQIPWR
jgi:sugar phosphate isomerase/epimerase